MQHQTPRFLYRIKFTPLLLELNLLWDVHITLQVLAVLPSLLSANAIIHSMGQSFQQPVLLIMRRSFAWWKRNSPLLPLVSLLRQVQMLHTWEGRHVSLPHRLGMLT